MIFQSFKLNNLIFLRMKIINSIIMVGLYYGFMITFFIRPFYLFFLRTRIMQEEEEGTKKKVLAIFYFIIEQFMMFILIYYACAYGDSHPIFIQVDLYIMFVIQSLVIQERDVRAQFNFFNFFFLISLFILLSTLCFHIITHN